MRFVYDEMIRYRDDARDAYKGEALNWVIFNSHEKLLRNKHGNELKQRELYQLEKKVADLINEGFISSYENLLIYLRNQYQKRNYSRVFDCAS